MVAEKINPKDRRLTHFHVACKYGYDDAVQKFLELGLQDPDVRVQETGESSLHLAVHCHRYKVVELLLRHDADPNAADARGWTPLHAICDTFCDDDLLALFFEINDSIGNNRLRIDARDKLGNTPLHFAVANVVNSEVIEQLLRRGADPNAANEDGETPLHVICKAHSARDFTKIFFKINAELNQPVEIDARDKFGRTPLQWAVARFYPYNVKLLLDHGADLSKFVFPTDSCFFNEDRVQLFLMPIITKLGIASGVSIVVESLEKGGCVLGRRDALIIMKFLTKHVFANSMDDDKVSIPNWYDNEEFAREAKKIKILPRIRKLDYYDRAEYEREKTATAKSPSLTLYDLIDLRQDEAEKILTYEDYFEQIARRVDFYQDAPERPRDAFVLHLCEKLWRGFFRRWALYPFWKLIRYRLPLEICKMVLENLTNKDLYNICVAAASQSDKDIEKNVETNEIERKSKRSARARKAPKRLKIVW